MARSVFHILLSDVDSAGAGAEAGVGEHDHFGVPVGMECSLTPVGNSALAFLDAMILPIPSGA
jgi:hypothetical protein